MITKDQYQQAREQKAAAEKIINDYCRQEAQAFDAKWTKFQNGELVFSDDELCYAAYSRCRKCGEGLAYPKDCTSHHQWTCSRVLKGEAKDGDHDAFSFVFYEVKSEDQPSAQGATTRPKKP